MINPKDKQLIRDFIDYVAHDGDSKGYVMVDKGNWSNSSMWHKQAPPKGEKTLLKLRFELYRPDDEEIDVQIETFLKKKNKE